MKILTCFQGENANIRIRLFDPISINRDEYIDLTRFSRFKFIVWESLGRGRQAVIQKNNDCISTSTDNPNPLGFHNTMNIQLSPSDTDGLIPNPPNRDRIRMWELLGEDAMNKWQNLDRGYFYIDSMVEL